MTINLTNFYSKDSKNLNALYGHASISSGSDNGAMNCITMAFPNAMRHDSTRKAIDNFIGRLQTQAWPLNLCGHGMPGVVETGSGQNGWDWDKIISMGNLFDWKQIVAELEGMNIQYYLQIVSCSTGARDEGADLLWEIAKAIRIPVAARTGFVYCNQGVLTVHPDSTWQIAYPWARPQPIPETPYKVIMEKNKIFLFSAQKLVISHDVDDVIISGSLTRIGQNNSKIQIPISEAKQIATQIFNSSIQNLPGHILGFVTLKLSFEVKIMEKTETIDVDIYNDSAAVIKTSNSMYFLPSFFRTSIGL
jgi:hypothetical protein